MALEKMEPFQDHNEIPTTIVYLRPSGFTPDRPRGHRGPGRRAQAEGRHRGQGVGPIPSEDNKAAQAS